MSAVVEKAKRFRTEGELQALPDDGYIHEVVKGELVMSSKNNYQHGDICTQRSAALHTYVRAHKLGAVWDSSTGFWMHNRNYRSPDISCVAKARLRGFKRSAKQFFPGAPDLAVEILAPSNTRAELDARLNDFFSSGTLLAWVIHPDEQFVEVSHSLNELQILGPNAMLRGENVLPGFEFPIAELFKEWDWE